MIENNIIFSLIVSLVNTISFYLFTHRERETLNDNHKQEMIMLFGISFASSFLIKSIYESFNLKEVEKSIDTKVNKTSLNKTSLRGEASLNASPSSAEILTCLD